MSDTQPPPRPPAKPPIQSGKPSWSARTRALGKATGINSEEDVERRSNEYRQDKYRSKTPI